MNFFNRIALGIAIILPLSASSNLSAEAVQSRDVQTKTKMQLDLDFIRSVFEIDYAPFEWKKEFCQWDLDHEILKAKQSVEAMKNVSIKEYHQIVKNFFNSTRDFHVGVSFFSTESSFLPFTIKGTGDRYFITSVDEDFLSPILYPINVGDELLSFNERPIHEVVLELQKSEFGSLEKGTERSLAEMILTNRSGTRGNKIETGPVKIKIKSAFTEEVTTFQLAWTYHPERITHAQNLKEEFDFKAGSKLGEHPFFYKNWVTPYYKDFNLNTKKMIASQKKIKKCGKHELGSKKSFIPSLGEIWWEAGRECPFHAYLFQTPDCKKIGYVRIAHYMGSEDELKEFAKIIQFFEDKTEALVIDQVNNPGGSVFYLYALASMLSDQCLATPKHRMAINYNDVQFALTLIDYLQDLESDDEVLDMVGDTIGGYPMSYQGAQFILDYARFIISEWNAGHKLTAPYHLFGVDQINPYPNVRYTKPILLLVNELDFSGGDFFPAILQDNQRALLLGTKTAGAGGYVTGTSFPNGFGINFFHLTGSIAQRVNQKPLENLGVTPDILYELDDVDYQFGYPRYLEAIHAAISLLTQHSR